MKTREESLEEILNEVLSIKSNHIVIAAGTGIGKTKIALEKAKTISPKLLLTEILVVVPRRTMKKDWTQEIYKWNAERGINYTITTYNSLEKYTANYYDMVIFDESHHITERVKDIMKYLNTPKIMFLSATMKPQLIYSIKAFYNDLYVYKYRLSDAIESGVLPDPKIILVPLRLNTVDKTESIIKNPKATKEIQGEFGKRHLYTDKKVKVVIPCTQAQYHLDLNTQIDWYKRKAMGGNAIMKNLWLHKCGERLKWLASIKNSCVKEILKKLSNCRTLTFCASIEQTEQLGSNCIHCKNKTADTILDKFNALEIKHITAVSMIDEGKNLTNCRVGIFANLNSSERIQIQRVGRILRHKSPIIIIPYFKNSREEEIVIKMLEGYNKDLIETVSSIEDIKL